MIRLQLKAFTEAVRVAAAVGAPIGVGVSGDSLRVAAHKPTWGVRTIIPVTTSDRGMVVVTAKALVDAVKRMSGEVLEIALGTTLDLKEPGGLGVSLAGESWPEGIFSRKLLDESFVDQVTLRDPAQIKAALATVAGAEGALAGGVQVTGMGTIVSAVSRDPYRMTVVELDGRAHGWQPVNLPEPVAKLVATLAGPVNLAVGEATQSFVGRATSGGTEIHFEAPSGEMGEMAAIGAPQATLSFSPKAMADALAKVKPTGTPVKAILRCTLDSTTGRQITVSSGWEDGDRFEVAVPIEPGSPQVVVTANLKFVADAVRIFRGRGKNEKPMTLSLVDRPAKSAAVEADGSIHAQQARTPLLLFTGEENPRVSQWVVPLR